MIKRQQIDRMAELTANHEDNFIYLKAAEELQELSIELLRYIKFANIQSGRKEAIEKVNQEIIDVHLVLAAAEKRLGYEVKDIGDRLRGVIDTELRDGGVWGLAAGVMDTVSQLVSLSKNYTQALTKSHQEDQGYKKSLHEANMDVRCHLYKLGLIFFLFEEWFDMSATTKMDRLYELQKSIPTFGTIQKR